MLTRLTVTVAALVLAGIQMSSGVERKDVYHVKPGPWGNLVAYPTILEPPDAWLWESLYNEYTTWRFSEFTIGEVRKSLIAMNLPEEWIDQMVEGSEWSQDPSGMVAYPPDDVVMALSQNDRSTLYGHLWSRGVNSKTLTIEGSRFEDLTNRDFDQPVIDLVNSLTYYRGNKRLFSDSPVVIKRFDSFPRKHAFIKALTRTQALVVRLQIDETTDIETVANYWAQGKSEKSMLPMLRSVQRAPNADSIDIVHLLPSLPRKYLNTYVRLEDVSFDNYPDCYWTVVNFSQAQPTGAATDYSSALHYFTDQFEEVNPPYMLGDVVVFFEEATDAFVHSAVLIADDIYYTKNGSTPVSPWILMREERMMSRYSDRLVYRRVYRAKADS